MSNDNMEEERRAIMKLLVTDLTNDDLYVLLEAIQVKLQKGQSPVDISMQLLKAAAGAIEIRFPDLEDQEIVALAEEVSNALLDRLSEYTQGLMDEEDAQERKIPHDQLN